MRRILTAAVAIFSFAVPASGQTAVIDTYTGQPLTGVVGFGIQKNGAEGYVSTHGQTFSTQGAWNLASASFWLANAVGGSEVLFRTMVMAWDPIAFRATGPVLYSSDIRTGPSTVTSNPALYQRYDFSFGPNGLQLGPNQQYVIFMTTAGLRSISPLSNGANGYIASLYTINDPYPKGQFVYAFPGDNFASLTADPWTALGGIPGRQEDLAIILTATPEPSSLLLFATGFLVVVGVGRVRRRSKNT